MNSINLIESDKINLLIDGLTEKGWATVDDFLPLEIANSLRKELNDEFEKGEFDKAGIGRRGVDWQLRPEIRSDYVKWLQPNQLTEFQQLYWTQIDNFKQAINQELYLSLNNFESHFAIYPPKSFYKKHLDHHQTAQRRFISCILYFNQDWKKEDGGELRIYAQDDNEDNKNKAQTDILPIFNRFVCMRSELIWHEVLPSEKRNRMSITGWLRREI
ncbi:2OG-Fe(II) oxygenase [Bernardetia sp. ABR2-2B]|uniref:2OG-Fe(II) oxygenase n=1 Tax=Bernardetia sp. ABR2-2B TaxID=3127472 RepID=UPI0030CD6EF0